MRSLVRGMTIGYFGVMITGLIGWGLWCSRPNNGIHPMGENALWLKGECMTINLTESVEMDSVEVWAARIIKMERERRANENE